MDSSPTPEIIGSRQGHYPEDRDMSNPAKELIYSQSLPENSVLGGDHSIMATDRTCRSMSYD
ncbi:hypothetical protein LAC03_16050 [Levilactobacillus acidifarinae]|nr:hypothetical protein LAC03_16050 [Levilactobacillus acidifarinae]